MKIRYTEDEMRLNRLCWMHMDDEYESLKNDIISNERLAIEMYPLGGFTSHLVVRTMKSETLEVENRKEKIPPRFRCHAQLLPDEREQLIEQLKEMSR